MPQDLILVIEDHDLDLKLVADLLSYQGYQVLEARTASLGLVLAAERQPCLILMDVQLSDSDGLSALKFLRARPHTASIPVIALTAMAMRGDRERMLEAGFDEYIAKPIDIDAFSDMVRRFCEAAREEELHGPTAEHPCRR
jgi:two-component system, cell cycle response regulator DivK